MLRCQGIPLQKLAQVEVQLNGGSSTRTGRRRLASEIHDVGRERTPHGPVLEHFSLEVNGQDVKIPYINPHALLYHLFNTNAAFASLVRDYCTDGVATIALYADETKPGNVLRPDVGRSMECIYWTVAEFPSWWRARRCGWMLFTVVLSRTLQQLEGGASALMAKCMKVFWSADGWNLESVGVRMPTGAVFRARFGFFVADEREIKYLWGVRGASGTKPCCSCRNVVGRMELEESLDTYLVHHTWGTPDRFDLHTRQSYEEARGMLEHEARHGTQASLAALSQVLGLCYQPCSVMFDSHLKHFANPADCTYWDWMHILLASGGVFQYEANQFVLAAQAEGVPISRLDSMSSLIHWPKGTSDRLFPNFFQKRVTQNTNGHIHAMASEMFSVARVLMLLVQMVLVPAGKLEEHCRCLTHMMAIIDILSMQDEALRHIEALRRHVLAHHSLFLRLYSACAKPKLHYLFHVADCLQKFKANMSCFAGERKHKVVKAIANHTFRHIEEHVVGRMLSDFIDDLAEASVFQDVHLLRPVNISNLLPGFFSEITDADGMLVARAAKSLVGEVRATDLLHFVEGGSHHIGFARFFLQFTYRCSAPKFYVYLESLRRTGTTWSLELPEPCLIDLRLVSNTVPYCTGASDSELLPIFWPM